MDMGVLLGGQSMVKNGFVVFHTISTFDMDNHVNDNNDK